jgi:hypothetical protein
MTRIQDESLAGLAASAYHALRGLAPFVERALYTKDGLEWQKMCNERRERQRLPALNIVNGHVQWEPYLLTRTLALDFDYAFKRPLRDERKDSTRVLGAINEINRLRNPVIGHPGDPIDEDDAFLFLTHCRYLVKELGSPELAEHVFSLLSKFKVLQRERIKEELVRSNSAKLEAIKQEFKNASSMLSHPVIYEFLEEECNRRTFFPGCKIEMLKWPIGGFMIPMAAGVLSSGTPIRLGQLDPQERIHSDVEKDDYVQKRNMLIGGTLIGKTDKLTYTIRRVIQTKENCVLEGGVTKYLSGLKSHHALQYELLNAAFKLHSQNKLTVDNLRPWLKKRERHFELPVEQQQWYRPTSISALIIYKSNIGDYKIMVRRRSQTVAVDPGLIQAIPSFMFQPEVDKESEWDIKHSIIKEYAEELFDEKVDDTRADDRDFIYRFQAARDLRTALQTEQCELLYSGLSLILCCYVRKSYVSC